MASQVQAHKSATQTKTEIEEAPKAKDSEALKADLDALLDEIDEVLEENATQLVHEFVQQGGE